MPFSTLLPLDGSCCFSWRTKSRFSAGAKVPESAGDTRSRYGLRSCEVFWTIFATRRHYFSMKFGMYSLIWRKVDLMGNCESKLFQIMRNFLFHWTQIFHVKVNKYEKCYNLILKMKLYCLIKSSNSGFLKLNRIILIIFTLYINFQLKYFLATKLFYIYK